MDAWVGRWIYRKERREFFSPGLKNKFTNVFQYFYNFISLLRYFRFICNLSSYTVGGMDKILVPYTYPVVPIPFIKNLSLLDFR